MSDADDSISQPGSPQPATPAVQPPLKVVSQHSDKRFYLEVEQEEPPRIYFYKCTVRLPSGSYAHVMGTNNPLVADKEFSRLVGFNFWQIVSLLNFPYTIFFCSPASLKRTELTGQ